MPRDYDEMVQDAHRQAQEKRDREKVKELLRFTQGRMSVAVRARMISRVYYPMTDECVRKQDERNERFQKENSN